MSLLCPGLLHPKSKVMQKSIRLSQMAIGHGHNTFCLKRRRRDITHSIVNRIVKSEVEYKIILESTVMLISCLLQRKKVKPLTKKHVLPKGNQ
jgi:hypothetical protein